MKGFCLEVSGAFACFTRPEMKVERVSYEVITPSAVRAIFEAIMWRPAIRWRPTRVEVLAPIRWISVRRNEVASVASPRKEAIFVEDDRQQRAGLFLRDVRYRLFAEFDFVPPEQRRNGDDSQSVSAGPDETPAKYAAMFERRARKGQCFNQPYLGCREFSAAFRLVQPDAESTPPISETRDLGWMLYDLDYASLDSPSPMFFHARLEEGVVRIPHPDSEEVRR